MFFFVTFKKGIQCWPVFILFSFIPKWTKSLWKFLHRSEIWWLFIKRQTSDTSSDNEWYIEWQRVVQRVTTSGTTSDNEWYNKRQRRQPMTTSNNEWQQVVILTIFPFYFYEHRNLPLCTLKRLFKHWRGCWRETIEVRIETSP